MHVLRRLLLSSTAVVLVLGPFAACGPRDATADADATRPSNGKTTSSAHLSMRAPGSLPGSVRASCRAGLTVLMAVGDMGLVRLDRGTGVVHPIAGFDGVLVEDVVARDELACVAVRPSVGDDDRVELRVLDLPTWAITQTINLGKGSTTLVGVVDGNRILVVHGNEIVFLNAVSGHVLRRFEMPQATIGGTDLVDGRGYVTMRYPHAVAVIDTKLQDLVDLLDTREPLYEVHVVGSNAFVHADGPAILGLRSRTLQPIVYPEQHTTRYEFFVDGDRVFMVGREAIHALNAVGTPKKATPLPDSVREAPQRAMIVDITSNVALVACGRQLVAVPLSD